MSVTITSAGPDDTSFQSSDPQHSVSGRILSLAASADFVRLYAGTFSGVWRSDDAGQTWRHLARPQPRSGDDPDVAGAIYAPVIRDLAVSPINPDIVLAGGTRSQFAVSRDGIYRSADGGSTWRLVLFASLGVSQIVFAPDDPDLVYAAIGNAIAVSQDAGETWTLRPAGGTVWHVAVGPREPSGARRVYAAGDNRIFRSADGGVTWREDAGAATIRDVRNALMQFQIANGVDNPVGLFAGQTADSNGDAPQILALEPGSSTRLYLAAPGGAFGPTFYDRVVPDGTPANTLPERFASEGSLWFGDYDGFDASGAARWVQLPGPPLYTFGSTPSGNTYVVTKKTSGSFLVCFSDLSHIHVSEGRPTATRSWHRLDGRDISAGKLAGDNSNKLFVHVDPHALVLTADFTLKPATGVPAPYDQNSVLDTFLAGSIWMANDGGVTRSDDGGRTWRRGRGLETLDMVNLAGLHGIGNAPAIYMGTVDNDDFFTRDGGEHWEDPISECGDCDAWFADAAQPGRVLEFDPRGVGMRVFRTPLLPFRYPDARDSTNSLRVPRPTASNVNSRFTGAGFRPIIQTLASEAPLPDGDYVIAGNRANGERVLFRTRAISTITSLAHWEVPNRAEQVGDPLPPGADVIQVSGGHANPVFYTSDLLAGGGRLFKLDNNTGQWKTIVPGGPPGRAAVSVVRFFVDPYDPQLIFLVDRSGVAGDPGIRVSIDGGQSWLPELALAAAMTAGGKIQSPSAFVIKDMLFVRGEPRTRFALGRAGVYGTTDGIEWKPLLNSIALPGSPEAGYFDPVSNGERTLYVACEGRSLLRVSPVPPPSFQPPPVFGLLELAALLEA